MPQLFVCGITTPRYHGVVVSRYRDAMVAWCNGSVVPRHHGCMVSTTVSRCKITLDQASFLHFDGLTAIAGETCPERATHSVQNERTPNNRCVDLNRPWLAKRQNQEREAKKQEVRKPYAAWVHLLQLDRAWFETDAWLRWLAQNRLRKNKNCKHRY